MTLHKANKHYREVTEIAALESRIKKLELLTGIQQLNSEIAAAQLEDAKRRAER